MKRLLITLALLALPALAFAQESTQTYPGTNRPLISASRLSLAVAVTHEWYNGEDDTVLAIEKEFALGGYGTYNLIHALDLIASGKRGVDSGTWNASAGLQITFFAGK